MLELGRRDVAERLVQALGVEPRDPFDDRELELGPGAPDAVGDQFGLEGVDEAFGQRVVVGVADRADRLQDVVVVERLLERVAGLLRAGVGVVHELEIGAVVPAGQCHAQRVEHEVGAHRGGELPADQAAGERVEGALSARFGTSALSRVP